MGKFIYRYLTLNKFSKQMLRNHEFYCSIPENVNDPFDSKAIFDDAGSESDYIKHYRMCLDANHPNLSDEAKVAKINRMVNSEWWQRSESRAEVFKDFRRKNIERFNNFGMVCFSKKKDNILMWSHYANGHSGFCLEFDRALLQKYCCAPFEDVRYKLTTFSELVSSMGKGHEIAKHLLLSKAKDWKYEAEVRMIVPLNTGQKVAGLRRNCHMKFPKEALTGIIFGCLMSEQDKDTIRSILSIEPRNKPFYYQAEMSYNAYLLKIVPIA